MIPTFRVAITPGDGIGKEVMPEGLRVIQVATERSGLQLECHTIDWASYDYHQQHGQMMPDSWKAQLKDMDMIFFGAISRPVTVPDHVSLWGSLLKFRREFDQHVNLYPVRPLEGIPYPLVNRKPGDIDYYVMREDTEGEYTSLGGTMYEGTDREIAIQESVYSRKGAERLLKFALDLVQSRQREHVMLATKSNGIAISMPWWDKCAGEVAQNYSDAMLDRQHIDILTVRFVLQPGHFDVVAVTNLLGNILSDLGPATTGTIGLVSSANLNPDHTLPSLLEPVHGSAPDIYGKNIANPTVMIWLGALVLDFFTQGQGAGRVVHNAIVVVIEAVLKDGPRMPDLGGTANTTQAGKMITAHVAVHWFSSTGPFTRTRYAFSRGQLARQQVHLPGPARLTGCIVGSHDWRYGHAYPNRVPEAP